MAFDPALPANSTKLRLAPGVIQDNWVAIQEAQTSFKPYAVNLNNRTPLGVANDPAAIADAYITYCKDDGAGNAELFGINESSQITQFTKGAPTLAATGNVFLPGGLILAWGQSATGAVPIVIAALTTIYQVVATVNDTSGTPTDRNIAINSKVGNQFTVYSSSAGQVNWIAIGV
jgi:hypothetical protein